MSGQNVRFAPYRNALNAISLRTGTPLPSLIVSFGILHELTAIVPLVGIFYGSRAFGVGERVVDAMVREDYEDGESGWLRDRFRRWVDEGDRWAKRIGTRYGIFGFQKLSSQERARDELSEENKVVGRVSERIAGDVANAVVAYGVTKARDATIANRLFLVPLAWVLPAYRGTYWTVDIAPIQKLMKV